MAALTTIVALVMNLIVISTAQNRNYAAPPRNIQLVLKGAPVLPGGFIYFADILVDPIQLTCTAEGNPKPIFKWKKDGADVTNRVGEIEVDSNSGVLKWIKPKDNIDTGSYQCFASNTFGIGMSSKRQLQKASIGGFPQGDGTLNAVGVEYQYKQLTCENKPDSIPAGEYRWSKIGPQNVLPVSERIAVDTKGNLHFLYLERVDTSTTTEPYQCIVYNGDAGITASGSKTQLTVSQGVAGSTTAPRLVSHTGTVEVNVNSEAVMECIFSGYDANDLNRPVQITWFDLGGREIQGSAGMELEIPLNHHQRRLVIKNVQLKHEGSYQCRAKNSGGQTAKTDVFLDVKSPPIWVRSFDDAILPVGSSAVFECDAKSPPGETGLSGPHWLKNGVGFTGNNPRYEFSPDMKKLTVKEVQKPFGTDTTGDNMSLQCLWTNLAGESFRSAALTVIEPITVLLRPEDQYKINPGQVLTISSNARTDPAYKLKYDWFFENENITTNSVYILSPSEKNLTIDTRNLEKSQNQGQGQGQGQGAPQAFNSILGSYRLRISHELDSEEIMFKLVHVPPPGPIVQAGGDLWWIAIVLGIIVIFIIVILIICLLYRNRGGEYPVDEKEVKAGHDPERELKDSGFHDLSRADNDDYDKPPKDTISLSESVKPIESDDDDEFGEYGGDLEFSKFNEDGSFIGIYGEKRGRGGHEPTQSAV